MKIKVFKFEVSNMESFPLVDQTLKKGYEERKARLISPEQIEIVVNNFIEDVESEGGSIININIQTVDTHYHNNGRGNTIHMWYTIQYEEAS